MAEKKNPAAVALGRKGGKNSRINLPDKEKERLAKKAAAARWGTKKRADAVKPSKKKKAV